MEGCSTKYLFHTCGPKLWEITEMGFSFNKTTSSRPAASLQIFSNIFARSAVQLRCRTSFCRITIFVEHFSMAASSYQKANVANLFHSFVIHSTSSYLSWIEWKKVWDSAILSSEQKYLLVIAINKACNCQTKCTIKTE